MLVNMASVKFPNAVKPHKKTIANFNTTPGQIHGTHKEGLLSESTTIQQTHKYTN